MTNNLSTLLARTGEIAARKRDLNKRREEIRAAKEKVFEAAGPDDAAAFARIGELGAQESLVVVQVEKLDRELAGLAASVLGEANFVRRAVAKALQEKRDKVLVKLESAIEPFFPDQKARRRQVASMRMVAPEIRALEKGAGGLTAFSFNAVGGDEFTFAAQVLHMAETYRKARGV